VIFSLQPRSFFLRRLGSLGQLGDPELEALDLDSVRAFFRLSKFHWLSVKIIVN
jgi:hypothetical protein